ncbi:MAG: cbb3-type cytochrome oxidase assembly protein CcoS [Gammaproteobacteria bacterium]|jgi:cbb3-type cytochrome oxidase maturation protein
MDILFLLIPISLIIMGIAVWLFLWAIRSGQFEDLEGPAHRILMDDDEPRIPGPQAKGPSESENSRGPSD